MGDILNVFIPIILVFVIFLIVVSVMIIKDNKNKNNKFKNTYGFSHDNTRTFLKSLDILYSKEEIEDRFMDLIDKGYELSFYNFIQPNLSELHLSEDINLQVHIRLCYKDFILQRQFPYMGNNIENFINDIPQYTTFLEELIVIVQSINNRLKKEGVLINSYYEIDGINNIPIFHFYITQEVDSIELRKHYFDFIKKNNIKKYE